jgi:hypothetical protein
MAKRLIHLGCHFGESFYPTSGDPVHRPDIPKHGHAANERELGRCQDLQQDDLYYMAA